MKQVRNCAKCEWLKAVNRQSVFGESVCYICSLSNRVITYNLATKCEYFNKDISHDNICYNCKYYLGGEDWGLACSKHYDRLPCFDSKICDDFNRKENENVERKE